MVNQNVMLKYSDCFWKASEEILTCIKPLFHALCANAYLCSPTTLVQLLHSQKIHMRQK